MDREEKIDSKVRAWQHEHRQLTTTIASAIVGAMITRNGDPTDYNLQQAIPIAAEFAKAIMDSSEQGPVSPSARQRFEREVDAKIEN